MERLTLEQLYKRAKQHARKCGRDQDADDFAGWLTKRYLEGHSKHQTIRQSFIDYLRGAYGNKIRQGKVNLLSAQSIDHVTLIADEPFTTIDVDKMLTKIKADGFERMIIHLKFVWGFTEDEIGKCAGIGGSRISQILKGILEKLREKRK